MPIEQVMIGACNACQLSCGHCAHAGLRGSDPRYQMPLDDLAALVARIQDLGCGVGVFMFNGPGEPLLWRHFNAAVRMLYASGLDVKIRVSTNGQSLNRIEPDVWGMLDRVSVSSYSFAASVEQWRYTDRLSMWQGDEFLAVVPEKLPASSFGGCMCYGPLYYKRMIFPHCGPPVFDAARRAGVDPAALAVPLAEWDPRNHPVHPPSPAMPCGWCWANTSVAKVTVRNQNKPKGVSGGNV